MVPHREVKLGSAVLCAALAAIALARCFNLPATLGSLIGVVLMAAAVFAVR